MSECSLYLISSGGLVPPYCSEGLLTRSALCKVGISGNVRSRFATLQTSSPYRLRLETCWVCPSRQQAEALEADVHTTLSPYRAVGEWFLSNPRFINFIISDYYCIAAIDDWGMSPFWVKSRLIGMGYDEDDARDTIVSNYGEGAFAA